MGIVSGIVVYVMIWWVLLFTILPWGVRPSLDARDGCAMEAPVRPRLRLKFTLTTGLASVVWAIVYWIMNKNFINFS